MDIGLFQQAGHNTNWNIETFQNDDCGEGIIFSPADYKKTQLEKLDAEILSASLFDPQYYLPSSQRKKLSSYPFFPEAITDGFSTTDFHAQAHESANQCLQFQIDCDFRYLVIPTRFHSQMYSDYFDQHEQLTVVPFLEQLEALSPSKPVYLGLAITSHMVSDAGFRKQLLNWVTKFPDLDGIYITFSDERETKQIQAADDLKNRCEFLEEAKAADLEILVGYCNTEGLVYACLGGLEVTYGAFENTRKFSIDRYVVNESAQRGPAPRIYLPGLFNWIRLNEAKNIRENLPELWSKIYRPTSFGDKALDALVEPNFNSPNLYKHHFCVYADQFDELSGRTKAERKEYLIECLNAARAHYQTISSERILIDQHGSNDHLEPWIKVLKGLNG
ncbi:hypothetical protein [Marinobacter sp.]|uniref:hypothetical protein n=1 Tax=Marinobacter sp. TaxID=50741 RepID=UPI003B52D4D7